MIKGNNMKCKHIMGYEEHHHGNRLLYDGDLTECYRYVGEDESLPDSIIMFTYCPLCKIKLMREILQNNDGRYVWFMIKHQNRK